MTPAPDGARGSLLLAVDIGNTNVTFGVFESDRLLETWRLTTIRDRMADEYRAALGQLLALAGLEFGSLRAAAMASVVPPVRSEVTRALEKQGVSVRTLVAADLGIEVRYDPPESVGVDRLVNAVAVREKYDLPAIVVDVGTATTLDVVDRSGAYVGGAIAPGIETSLNGLVAQAFQLPKVALKAPASAIGRTTAESIQSGTLLGYTALIDGLIERFTAEIEGRPAIVGTGGLAGLVAPHTKCVRTVDDALTLEGLRIAYQRLS